MKIRILSATQDVPTSPGNYLYREGIGESFAFVIVKRVWLTGALYFIHPRNPRRIDVAKTEPESWIVPQIK